MLELIASIYSIRMDREGACRVTLDIPETHLAQAVALMTLKEKALAIRIMQEVE
jgi:hypothetical protein